jgi:hypothetical protein
VCGKIAEVGEGLRLKAGGRGRLDRDSSGKGKRDWESERQRSVAPWSHQDWLHVRCTTVDPSLSRRISLSRSPVLLARGPALGQGGASKTSRNMAQVGLCILHLLWLLLNPENV